MTSHKTPAPCKTQSGNVFFAIFGAVAVVSLLGAGLMTFVRGPISSAVTMSRQSAAENQMVIGAQTALMNATAQAAAGDCDTDLFVEPVPWKTPGAVPAPVGGGLIPNGIAAPKRDPWGADYGYCVWDHGPTVGDAACGGVAQNRLAGADSRVYPSLSIISSGPDKIFQTTCRNFGTLTDAARADQNDDGDLEDAGDFKLVDKSTGSDDLIFSYTYDEAVAATGDMWTLRSSNSVAGLDKNLEVAGDAIFSGGGDFIGVTGDRMAARSAAQIDMPGIRLPDATTYNPSCTPALQGVVRTNLDLDAPKAIVSAYSYARPFRNADTATASLNSLTTAGNSIIVVVRGFQTGGFELLPANVSDNQGNIYQQIGFAGAPGSDARVMMFAAYNVMAPTGNLAVSINPTGASASGTLGVLEVAGIDSGSLDITGSSTINNGGVTASGATSLANELAIGVIGVFDSANANSNFSTTTGWTQPIVQNIDVQMSTAVKTIPTAAATVAHSWNYANAPQSVRKFMAVFRPSGTVVTCPAGYTTQLGKCYKVVNASGTYAVARAACQAEGGDLVSINDATEYAYMNSQVPAGGYRAWVGYNWNGSTHEWLDSTATYTNWFGGEPNGGGASQSCGIMYSTGLADEDCNNGGVPRYVCEHGGTVSVSGSGSGEVVFEQVTESIGDGSSVVSKPSGTAIGDLLVWSVSIDNGAGLNVTWPNGFTEVDYLSFNSGGDSQGLTMAYKIADGTEPATFSMNIPGGANVTSTMLRYSNVDGADPIDVVGTRTTPASANPTPIYGPSLTTTVPNARVVWASSLDTNQDWNIGQIGLTSPTGFVEHSDQRSSGGWTFMNVADRTYPSAGITGDLNGQVTIASTGASATAVIALAIKPGSGTGGGGGSVSGPQMTLDIAAARGGSVNLTDLGYSDWAIWTSGSTTPTSRKLGGGNLIPLPVHDAGGADHYDNDPRTISYSDGTPTTSGSYTDGIYRDTGSNQGFEMNFPADTTPRTAKIYIGHYATPVRVTTTMSDGSSSQIVDTSIPDPGTAYSNNQGNATITVTYAAASPGQTMNVRWETITGGNVTLQAAALGVDVIATCPAGYVSQFGGCYKYQAAALDQAASRAACQADGGDLVSINNTAEFNYINSMVPAGGFRAWLGYTRVGGVYEWFDNTSTYTNWFAGEPNGADTCTVLYGNGGIADDPCHITYVGGYVCEHDGSAPPVDGACTATIPCDGGSGKVTNITPVDGFFDDPDRLRTITLAKTPAAGESIIVTGELWGSPGTVGVVSVTDNRGNTYVPVVTGDPTTDDLQCHGTASKGFPFMYIANNIPAPAGSVTLTLEVSGNGTEGNWGAMTVKGLQSTTPLDQTGKVQADDRATTTTVATAGSMTSGNQFVVAVNTQDGASDPVGNNAINYGIESGWREVYTVNDPTPYSGLSVIYKNVKPPAAVSHTWSHFPSDSVTGPSCGRSAIIATFRTLDDNSSCLVDEGQTGTDGSGAPAYKTSSYAAGTGGSLNVTLPAGTSIGDLLIWSVSIDNGEGLTPAWPYGFTQIGYSSMASPDGQGLGVAWKIVDGTEPATLIANFGGTTTVSAVSRYTGFDTTDPIDVVGTATTANLGTQPWTVTGPVLSPTVKNTRVVWVSAADTNTQEASGFVLGYTPPSGFQERFDTYSDPNSGIWSHLTVADAVYASAGSTGSLVGTASDYGSANQASFGVIAFSIKPDPAAAIDDGYTPAAAPTAPALRSSSVGFGVSGVNTVAKPPGTNVGDLLVWLITRDGDFNPDPILWPYGFNHIAKDDLTVVNGEAYAAAWKIADGTEPATFTHAFSNNWDTASTVLRYTGYDPVQPIETSWSLSDTGALPFAASWPAVGSSIITTVPNTRVIWFATTDKNNTPQDYPVTYQPPAGFHERVELRQPNANMAVADKIFPLAGPTGPLNGLALDNWAVAGGSSYSVDIGVMVLGIRPGAGGGGSDQTGPIEYVGSAVGRSTYSDAPTPPAVNVNVTAPSAILSGDLIVLAQSTDLDTYNAGNTTTITWPNGFTTGNSMVFPASSQQVSWAWKVANGSERNLTVASSRSWQTDVALSVYRGVDPANPIGAHSGYMEANDAEFAWPYSVPGVTVPNADSSLVLIPFSDTGYEFGQYYGAHYFTAPDTFIERVNSYYAPNTYAPLGIFDRMGVAAGATGPITGSMKHDAAYDKTNMFSYVGGFLLSLNPGDSRNAGGGPSGGVGTNTPISCDPAGSLLQMCDGAGNWRAITGAGGYSVPVTDNSGVCDADATSVIRYNTSANRPEYCNGMNWQSFTINEAGVVLMATPASVSDMNSVGNTWSNTETITITNRGSETSGALTIGLTGADINKFDYAGMLGVSTCDDVTGLAPGASCTVNVAANSATDGLYSANLEVNDASSVAVVSLSGVGSQNAVCAPGKLGWGGVVVSCLNATTPYYVLTAADCAAGTSEPACTHLNGGNDPQAEMRSGSTDFYIHSVAPTTQSPEGDVNTRGLLSYGTYAAARVCEDLVKDGYDNWYLPSQTEWESYLIAQRSILKFDDDLYWTSTNERENPCCNRGRDKVLSINITNGNLDNNTGTRRFRCLRKHGASIPAVNVDILPYDDPINELLLPAYTTTLGGLVTSQEFFVSGINTSVAVTVSGGGSPEFRIRDKVSGTWGAYGTSGNVTQGDKVQIRMTAPAVAGQETAVKVQIGSGVYNFTARTTQTATRKIFITSQTWNGNLGSYAGADAKCQAAAGAATPTPLAGTWYALLGGTDVSPFERVPWNWNRLELMNGTFVANNMSALQLRSPTLPTIINRTESNNTFPIAQVVWTGAGTHYYTIGASGNWNACGTAENALGRWTTNSSSNNGTAGSTANPGAWMHSTDRACNLTARLYCVGPF